MKQEMTFLADGAHISEPANITDVHSKAISGIRMIPDSKFDEIALFKGDPSLGPIERFAATSAGRSLSQAEFMLSYAAAVNAVATNAIERLKAKPSLKELGETRDRLQQSRLNKAKSDPNAYPTNGLLDGLDYMDPTQLLDHFNSLIHQQIIEVANGNQEETDIKGLDLAIMSLEQSTRHDQLLFRIEQERQVVLDHLSVMKQARELAKTDEYKSRFPQAQTEYDLAFLISLDLKLESQRYIPKLITLHDVDGNILPQCDSFFKPGNITGRLVNHLDNIAMTPPGQRLQLIDSIHQHPRLTNFGRDMFKKAGRNAGPVFADVATALSLSEQSGADFILITANMTPYAEGVAEQFQNGKKLQIIGVDHDSYTGQVKSDRLLEIFLDQPDGVLLVSEDGYNDFAEALEMGTVIEKTAFPVPLENITFLAARVAGNEETDDYKIASELKRKSLPFAENSMQPAGDETYIGYQGVVRTLKLYSEWKKEKVKEGWPLDKTGALAQKEIGQMIAGARHAYKEALKTRWERQKKLSTSSLSISELNSLIQQAKNTTPEELVAQIALKLASSSSREQHLELADLMLELDILQAKYGLAPQILTRASDLYLERSAHLPENSPKRPLAAVTALRQATFEWESQEGKAVNGTEEGMVRIRTIGMEKVADMDLGNLSPSDLEHIWSRSDVSEIFDRGIRFLMIRFTNGLNEKNLPLAQTLIIERDGGSEKLMVPEGKTIFDGRGILLSGEEIKGHNQQTELFEHHLRSFVEIALVYYRNAFNGRAGGLETVMREHAQILQKLGFAINIVGGNSPDSAYSPDFLQNFKHSVIDGTTKQLAKGIIPDEFYSLRDHIKEQLLSALSTSDILAIHHVLNMPHNHPFTAALVDLIRSGELPKLTNIVAVTHDVGKVKNASHYHSGYPWSLTANQLVGVTYAPVSMGIEEMLRSLPDEDTGHKSQIVGPVYGGVDWESFEPDNRVRRAIMDKLELTETDSVFLMPMRIAENKNIRLGIEALSAIPNAKLIITGPPHRKWVNDHEVVSDEYYDFLKALIKELDLEDRVLLLFDEPGVGEIKDQEFTEILSWLYSITDAVFMPSNFEGWNLASNEAGALRTPVIVSAIPVHRENLKNYAYYIDPKAHALEAATVMVRAVEGNKQTLFRREVRKRRNWLSRIKQVLYIFDGGRTDWIEVRRTTD